MSNPENKYEKQVRDAANPIKWWLGRSEGITSGSRFETPRFQSYYDGSIESTCTRLRLDFEVNDEDQTPVAKFIIEQLVLNISDLVENGDSGKSDDALYKALDGAKVRGTEPENIEFLAANVYKEVKPKKESTEYTLYIVLAIDWA
jgi:hypothetical protein